MSFFAGGAVLGAEEDTESQPALLAMVDIECSGLIGLAGELSTMETAGPEAIDVLERLSAVLPEDMQPAATELRDVLVRVEDGDLSVLRDEATVEAARVSGDAILGYIDERCGVDLMAAG